MMPVWPLPSEMELRTDLNNEVELDLTFLIISLPDIANKSFELNSPFTLSPPMLFVAASIDRVEWLLANVFGVPENELDIVRNSFGPNEFRLAPLDFEVTLDGSFCCGVPKSTAFE